MAKETPRHYYLLTANYGPQQLFLALRDLCEAPKHKDAKPSFEFDWMKRKIAISAENKDSVVQLSEKLQGQLTEKLGGEMLLLGKIAEDQGVYTRPIGVMLQSPDVYAEVIVNALLEFGVKNLQYEDAGDGFSILQSSRNKVLSYGEVIESFPVPGYIKVNDRGIQYPSERES